MFSRSPCFFRSPLEKISRNSLSKHYPLAFSGIQIVNPKIFEYMPAEEKFSIVEFYLNLAANNNLGAYLHNHNYWFDLGTTEKITEAELFFIKP